jgi:FkbM family methyltransferase
MKCIPRTIFDVGAHIGQTANEFRRRFPKARIFSFEPFPNSFQTLSANFELDPKTKVFNYGFAEKLGKFPFHDNSSSATNSLLSTDAMGSVTWGEGLLETNQIIQAEFKTIDYVVRDLNIEKIDILKLDVQGAEFKVLKGAAETFKTRIVDIIYSEIITQPTYSEQKRLDQALAIFYDAGFELHNIYDLNSSSDGKLRQFDVIFTRSDRG